MPIAAVLRGTSILVPSGELIIEPCDEILFIAHPGAEDKLPELV